MELETVKLWYNIIDCGDGSANIQWYLTDGIREIARQNELNEYDIDVLGDGSVDTFVGSDIHKEAISNTFG